jgi:alkylhydroperoxidase family enzyme
MIDEADLWPEAYAQAARELAAAAAGASSLEYSVREAARRRVFELRGGPAITNADVATAERTLAEQASGQRGVPAERVELAEAYTDRFVRDHRFLNHAFFERLRASFDETEIAELAYFVSWFDSVYGAAEFVRT